MRPISEKLDSLWFGTQTPNQAFASNQLQIKTTNINRSFSLQEITLLNGFNRGGDLKTKNEIEEFGSFGEAR